MKLRMPEMPPATLLAALASYNLLPAIVFMPTRRRCDQAASETALMRRDSNDVRREARRDFMRSAVAQHQDPQRIAELLRAPPDPLLSQFRATYTTLLNLLDAYGSFAGVREIAERSFAHREAALQIAQLEKARTESQQQIQLKLNQAGCDLLLDTVIGFERLVSARARLHESKPQTRAEALHRWLDEVVEPG